MKRTFILLSLVGVVASLVACTPRDNASYSCLDSGRSVVDVPSDHLTPWPASLLPLPDETALDARSESFDNTTLTSSGFGLGVKVHRKDGTRTNLCLTGGTVFTQFDAENTPWDTWHRVTGMTIEVDGFSVVGTQFRNEGDMVAFIGAADWKVIGVRADGGSTLSGAYIHDDCVENDSMQTGLIDDSKLDGCNTFLSSMSSGDGTGHTVTVRDTLVRLQPYRNSYNVAKYGESKTGGFFKWASPAQGQGTPPQLDISNSTFRADQKGSYSGNSNGFLGLPPGTRCDNVTLIGSEVWKASDLASWQSQCTNLHYGTIAEWNTRTATWDAAHPRV